MARTLCCDALDCVYNRSKKCRASVIQVNDGTANRGRETYCHSYTNARGGHTDSDPEKDTDTEFGADQAANPDNAPKIACTVGKCAYNKGYVCHAPHVDIGAPGENGSMRCECRTFRPK